MQVKTITLVAAATLAVAACASTKTEETTPVTGQATVNTIVPGSEADFVATADERVFFAYDSFAVDSAARSALQGQAAWLAAYPGVKVQIQGNCDERGTREYNLALGARRANAVKDELVRLGVDPSRIEVISFGKEKPIALGSDEGSFAQNRNALTAIVGGAVS